MSNDQKTLAEPPKPLREHISIPWDVLRSLEPEGAAPLQFSNPILNFADTYNYLRDKNDAGEGWAEHVLTKLTHAEALEDLRTFTPGDWYVCALLLQSNLPVPRRVIGQLIEKLVTELTESKIDVPSLGIKKPRRGRPASSMDRRRYLFHLMREVRTLTTDQGMTASAAYEAIAERRHTSPDTIRRDYERFMADRKSRMKQSERKDAKQ